MADIKPLKIASGIIQEVGTGDTIPVANGGTGQSTQWLPQAKAKTADESVTSSATLQNDDHLSFEGVAGATYQFSINGKATANASGGFKWAFTLPASGSGRALTQIQGLNDADIDVTVGSGVTGAIAVTNAFLISGYITFSTAGTAQFKWAQNASNGTATTLKRGSNLSVIRIS